MFDFVRKHTRIMQFLLFLLIVPSFVLFGIDGYSRFNEKGPVVAKVAGRDITQSEWDAAHRSEAERIRQSMPSLDPKLLDSPEARHATLDRLVRESVLAAAATDLKLTTSDARLARELQENPTIASLRDSEGRLDMERYRRLVASQGMTPEMFEAQVRADLSTRQVLQGLTGSTISSGAQARVALDALLERREVHVVRWNPSEFAGRVTITDADLEASYRRNEARYQAPEQADIEYLVLDVDTIKKSITVSEADLKAYYEQNAERLSGQEERRASHILISAPRTSAESERQKAKAKAEELLAQARKAPDTFAELARKNSQDPGSASKGGDLDFFVRGAMVKPFEDAAFVLKKGEFSPVVETEYGFHIIRLTDIKTPQARGFDEMKAELEEQVRKQQAQRKFQESAEAFSNGVYEQPDSLKPVAERLKLEIRTANAITRAGVAGVAGPLSSQKFLAALFSSESVDKKRNTEAVETASNQLVSGRILKYQPAKTRPFAEVKDQVRAAYLNEKGAELARQEGAAQLAKWREKADDAVVLPPALVVSRDQTGNLLPEVLEAALKADPTRLPGWLGVDLGEKGYAVVRVNKVIPRPTPDAETLRQETRQYAQLWAGLEGKAYYNLLKERYKVQILAAKPAVRTGEEAGSTTAK